MQALCRVTWQNPSVFQNVLEVMGLSVVCQALTQGITRVQQAVVTMFGALVSTTAHLTRLTQDKVLKLLLFGFVSAVPLLKLWASLVILCVCVCVCVCCVYVSVHLASVHYVYSSQLESKICKVHLLQSKLMLGRSGLEVG